MFIFAAVAITIIALAHTAPAPFLLELGLGSTGVWSMPRRDVPTVYLTFDDGPNPSTTPLLLDVLEEESVPATFFVIDDHLTPETAPILERTFAEGHAVGLHTGTRRWMLMPPDSLAAHLSAFADRIESLGGRRPCRLFRPHAGWRSGQMYEGLDRSGYKLVGWGWMLWDFNWFRRREGNATYQRIASRVSDGDIVVMHDGDESAPTSPQLHTVEATRRLIPELRGRGFAFGTIC